MADPFPLVDGGQFPCNLTFVDNLADALLAAASAAGGAGERYFVNGPSSVSWRKYSEDLGALLNVSPVWVPLSREEVLNKMLAARKGNWFSEHLRILASGEFRAALSMLPALAWLNNKALAALQGLPVSWQRAVRRKLSSPPRIERQDTRPEAAEGWARLQVRRFYHSPETLELRLGWKPVISYERGLELTAEWLRFIGLCKGSAGKGESRE